MDLEKIECLKKELNCGLQNLLGRYAPYGTSWTPLFFDLTSWPALENFQTLHLNLNPPTHT